MLSDLYWKMFLCDGSIYNFIKYSYALKKEGNYSYDAGQADCRCIDNTGTTSR